jgi:uncharacterized protein (UPF0548 family)
VTVELLDPAKAAALQAAPLTYPEVGATVGAMPDGYHAISRRVRLRTDFEQAVEKLFAWQVQVASGLRVQASSRTVEPKAVVVLRLGPIRVPCRVVYVVDQQHRKGFAYGTLPGHPESGEEAFMVERNSDGTASFTVTAFSKPATLLAKLGGPFPRMAQNLVTDRYLKAL